jgi:hypothetical protein
LDIEFESKWKEVNLKVTELYGEALEIDALLFLIGVQELGKGFIKLNKSQKLDLMHVAICSLLAPYGYYEFAGHDSDGWPHWNATEKLPFLKPLQQHHLMRQAIVVYFEQNDLIRSNN